jgi:PAS domain S-box-containing protein
VPPTIPLLPSSGSGPTLGRVLAAVREAPDELGTILEACALPLIAFASDRTILVANMAAERFLGYGRHELDSKRTDTLVPERLRQANAPPPVATRDIVCVELPGVRKDGTEIALVWTFGSVPGPHGPIFVTVVQDCSEAAVHSTEATFRLLADSIPALAWYAEPDGRIPWYNQRWFEFTGTTLEDQAGWGWQSVHDPADLSRVVARWKAALESGEPWEDEFRLRRHDGQLRWFLSRALPLRDASGRIVRWFGTNVDIDDQKRAAEKVQQDAQAELHAFQERFHRLVDAVSDYAIFLLDTTGHVVTWNPGARKIKGYEPDEIIGRHFSVFYTSEDRASGKPQRVLETVRREGRFEDESWRVRKDGSRFWANVVITALCDQKGEITGFAKVSRDLTERRAAEENERELAREQLARAASERISRAKDEFLATMSHELRTPLNAISIWATILRRKPRAEEQLDLGLETIERNAKAQTKLVSDLLDVARIVTGKLGISLVTTEMFPLIVATVDVVKPAADAKGVDLVVNIDPAIGTTMVDPQRLQQIMWNLLTNAVRFTPQGGHVTIGGARTTSGIVVTVQDTGAGIAPEHLPHLFERFMQVDSSTTRSHGGLGLGLSIVRQLAEAHGGTVRAQSAGLGRGATFTVALPIRAGDQPGAAAGDAGSLNWHSMSLQNVRALVVDDDLDSLDALSAMLRAMGAVVTPVASAREAFEVLEARRFFDVVISDIGMPEMDGYAFIRALRARESGNDVPAIAVTAYAHAEDVERAKGAGYQEHLAKPVEERRLLAAVKKWTWSRRPAPPSNVSTR